MTALEVCQDRPLSRMMLRNKLLHRCASPSHSLQPHDRQCKAGIYPSTKAFNSFNSVQRVASFLCCIQKLHFEAISVPHLPIVLHVIMAHFLVQRIELAGNVLESLLAARRKRVLRTIIAQTHRPQNLSPSCMCQTPEHPQPMSTKTARA